MSQYFKSPLDSDVELTELMIPSYANFSGKIHGGILLSLMDKVAYACAAKHSGGYCVTVAVEGVEFLSPVEVGELVTLKARVNYTGRTTMLVGIRVETLRPETGEVKHTNSSYFTMAAKDNTGELKVVPGILIQDTTELRRFCEGKFIKKNSEKRREMLKSNLKDFNIEHLLNECADERCQLNPNAFTKK